MRIQLSIQREFVETFSGGASELEAARRGDEAALE